MKKTSFPKLLPLFLIVIIIIGVIIALLILLTPGLLNTLNGSDNNVLFEHSSISIISAVPAEGADIDYQTMVALTVEYNIGNYDSSTRYFISTVLVTDKGVTDESLTDKRYIAVSGNDVEEINSKTGIVTIYFEPSILYISEYNDEFNYYPPYEFIVILDKAMDDVYFTPLANDTIIYN
ncbi:MAG: hypothetical protein PHW96_00255 [Candidatus Nanoarchaeia archaeon]|nr:hypothetical protein [Candidatus Nanoarchaeia archaeon]